MVADERRTEDVRLVRHDQPQSKSGATFIRRRAELLDADSGMDVRPAKDLAELKQREQGVCSLGLWEFFELADELGGKQQRFFQASREWDVRW